MSPEQLTMAPRAATLATVWCVFDLDYYPGALAHVASSRERAEAWVERQRSKTRPYSFEIAEWPIDESQPRRCGMSDLRDRPAVVAAALRVWDVAYGLVAIAVMTAYARVRYGQLLWPRLTDDNQMAISFTYQRGDEPRTGEISGTDPVVVYKIALRLLASSRRRDRAAGGTP